MKGIELPINILVVVAIAVIVLLGLVALFFVGFGPFGQQIAINAAKNKACANYTTGTPACTKDLTTMPVDFDVSGDGKIDSSDLFSTFAITYLNCPATPLTDLIQCVRQACACPGY